MMGRRIGVCWETGAEGELLEMKEAEGEEEMMNKEGRVSERKNETANFRITQGKYIRGGQKMLKLKRNMEK